jgi:hypothetical protein
MTYDTTNPPTQPRKERGALMAAMVYKGWTPIYVGPVVPGDEYTADTAVVISLMPEKDARGGDAKRYQVHTAVKNPPEGWVFMWGKYDLDAKSALMHASEKTQE